MFCGVSFVKVARDDVKVETSVVADVSCFVKVVTLVVKVATAIVGNFTRFDS